MILRQPDGGAVMQPFHRFGQCVRPQCRQPRRQHLRVLIGVDGRLAAEDHISGVQLLGHIHDGDAGDAVPIEDRPVDRRRAPVFRQNRGMHVDRAVGRRVQNILRQYPAVSRHHDQLRRQLLHEAQRLAVPQLHRLVHGDANCQGIFLHRRKRHFMPSVFGLVRLGEHAAHVVAVLHQPLQGRHGKVGRTHKQYSHSSSSPFSASHWRMYASSSSSVSR